MRRQALIKAVNTVVDDIEETSLHNMFNELLSISRKKDVETRESAFHFRTFLDYALRVSHYTSAEKQVLEVMGLDDLQDPDWWQSASALESPDLWTYSRNLHFALEYLPRLVGMLERDYVDQTEAESKALLASGMDTLSILLVEDHDQRSTPDRLILTLQGVTEIYQAIATMEGESHNDLAVVAIDSGSDKSFDFLGLAKVMEIFKETLLAIWDRRVFHRHVHVSLCIQTIAESLPVIQQIHDMKEAGAISPEQAELLKRQMVNGTSKLLEVGAISSEMEAQPGASPRALMRPEPKLLAAPIDPGRKEPEADIDSDAPDDSDLSKEEVDELERLVAKAKKSHK
ncbi:hypothetical protein H8F23_26565 [Pseudomonas sp. P155]|uniref:Uncharacterized protein n=1 Tax=Pseudomonas neuropathica TaxID=2730425 RepID=A0ABS0BQV8_9PSED|nr:hypothetical protein [Pseudomonas neuropathica]MBF6036829.1 hypothetical protein [Pseudomonas neuropathica]